MANLLLAKIIGENDTLSFPYVEETNYVHEEQRVVDPIDLETAMQSETIVYTTKKTNLKATTKTQKTFFRPNCFFYCIVTFIMS